MNSIKKWFFIIRPFTLSASISPVLVGLYVAGVEGRISIAYAVITLLCAMSLQVLSNLINDLLDFKKGADVVGRKGPQRAISQGLITEKQLKRAIYTTLVVSIISGGALVYEGGIAIAAIGISAIIFAWLYSATSHSLSALGIADLFAFAYYGPIASFGTTYIQLHSFSLQSLMLGVACGAISAAILNVNNIRDVEEDRKVNKHTLIVRFSVKFGKIYYAICLLMPAIMIGTVLHNFRLSAILLAVAILLYIKFIKSNGTEYNKVLALTGLFDLLFAACINFA